MFNHLTFKLQYIKQIKIYENENNIIFIGKQNIKNNLCYLIFKKYKFENNHHENSPNKYSLSELIEESEENMNITSLQELLVILSNKFNKQFKFVNEIDSIFGFIKFYLGYYAILVQESSIMGRISNNIIYRANNIIFLPLFTIETNSIIFEDNLYKLEEKYITLVKNFDLNEKLYFSYSYNISKTLQRNYI